MASPDYESERAPETDELSQDSKPLDAEKGEDDVGDISPIDALEDSTEEYPHGARLAIIVISLMLSTFLVALDNVSDYNFTNIISTKPFSTRLLLLRQFQKSQTNFMVWTRCRGMARHIS
jgi:hypothetical protein